MTPNKRLLLGATLSLCVLSCGPASTEPAENQATEMPDMSKATCDTDPPHDRCSASPDTYNDWSPSSIVSEIRFIDDDSCCFDIDGDGQNDNALGDLLEIAASAGVNIDGFNESVAQSIEDGTVALLAEHHHIAEEGGEFSINYYLGIPDGGFTAPVAEGGNAYKIDRGDDFKSEVSMCKHFVANALNRIIDRAIQVHGAGGLSQDFPLANAYASIRTLRFADGPDEVHRRTIARIELKRQAERSGIER